MNSQCVSFDQLPSLKGRSFVGDPQGRFAAATWLDRASAEDVLEFPDTIVEGFFALSPAAGQGAVREPAVADW